MKTYDLNGTIAAEPPGFKDDSEKPRCSLVLGDFSKALLRVSEVGTLGAIKYDDSNWLFVPNATQRYDDAMLRHWLAEKSGKDNDEETGLEHAAHTAWNALARLELILRNKN